mmetsp:Transcript_34934/g.86921  ORF Transcript_34934/g.86921 Transcript_34934/m.86921 type:complete len:83 (-) Transcript_34934:1034-1282(-)
MCGFRIEHFVEGSGRVSSFHTRAANSIHSSFILSERTFPRNSIKCSSLPSNQSFFSYHQPVRPAKSLLHQRQPIVCCVGSLS